MQPGILSVSSGVDKLYGRHLLKTTVHIFTFTLCEIVY